MLFLFNPHWCETIGLRGYAPFQINLPLQINVIVIAAAVVFVVHVLL